MQTSRNTNSGKPWPTNFWRKGGSQPWEIPKASRETNLPPIYSSGHFLLYGVGIVSRFMHQHQTHHMEVITRILMYLKVMPGRGIVFWKNGRQSLLAYMNAAGDRGWKKVNIRILYSSERKSSNMENQEIEGGCIIRCWGQITRYNVGNLWSIVDQKATHRTWVPSEQQFWTKLW